MAQFPDALDDFPDRTSGQNISETHINELQDAVETLEAKIGINSSSVATSLDYKVNNFFVAGRKIYLYENVAPTGWTTVALSDIVLAIKGGSQNYNISGGNIAGDTWGSGTSHGHGSSGGPVTLSIAQIPSHAHNYVKPVNLWPLSLIDTWAYVSQTGALYASSYVGGGASHSHSVTVNNGQAIPSTWRPRAAVGIMVQKG